MIRFRATGLLVVLLLDGYWGGVQLAADGKQQSSQENVKKANRDKQRQPDLLILLGEIRSAPPEFASDLLIRLAESSKIVDLQWKKELLEEAFHLAFHAQQRALRNSVSPYTDTRNGFLKAAFDLKLDAMSLQCRAIHLLLKLEKTKARSLFELIGNLRLDAPACSDGFVYDVTDFYATLGKLAEQSFTIEERAQDQHVRFVDWYVSSIVSPVQLAPAAKMIYSLKLSPVQRERLVHSLTSVLAKISGDDRSFARTEYLVADEVLRLRQVCGSDAIATDGLTLALRGYLVRHFSAARCADSLGQEVRRGRPPASVIQFNKELGAESNKKITPIEVSEVKAAKIEGEVKEVVYWSSPFGSQFLPRVQRLRFGAENNGRPPKPLSLEVRQTEIWKTEARQMLTDAAAWDFKEGDADEDHLHQRCMLFRSVLELMPDGPEWDEVLSELIIFLDGFDIQRGSRVEWFWHANVLLNDPRLSEAAKKSKALKALDQARNPVLSLYRRVKILTDSAQSRAGVPAPGRE